MIRRNLVLASAVAVVFGSSPHVAAFDVSTPDAPIGVASESKAQSTVPVGNIDTKLGRNIDKGAGLYVRFELSEGATFDGISKLTLAALASMAPASFIASVRSNSPSSGGSGNSFVIYALENTADGAADNSNSNLFADDKIKLVVTNVKIANPGQAVKLTYSTYGTAMQAASKSSPSSTTTVDFIEFKSGFSFRSTANTLTADVESNFQKFAGGNEYGSLASITLASEPQASVVVAGSTAAGLARYLGPSDSLFKIEGDFSSFVSAGGTYNPANVFMIRSELSSDCSKDYTQEIQTPGNVLSTASLTATEAVISMANVPTTDAVTYQLCVKRDVNNADTQFKASEYVLDFTPSSTGDVNLQSRLGQPVGRIARDGTVLDAPFFTLAPGYISRIMLSNFGARDANFTIHLQSDEGNVPTINTDSKFYNAETGGLGGTLKAGTMLQINATDLVTSFSTKTRGSAKFTIVAPPQNIEGIYQAVNQGTGEVSNLHLIHEGGAAAAAGK